jgi:hypothetical protein
MHHIADNAGFQPPLSNAQFDYLGTMSLIKFTVKDIKMYTTACLAHCEYRQNLSKTSRIGHFV